MRPERLSEQAKHNSTRQRAATLPASATEMSALARMRVTDESHVRKVSHDLNQHGVASTRPHFRGGPPGCTSTENEQRIVLVAGRPDTLEVPVMRSTLAQLAE